MNFRENEDAVSPVIGVILMVAITVILAAVIAAFVFGMAGNVETTKSVAATAKQQGSTNIIVTYQGGPDSDDLTGLRISAGTTATESTTSVPSVGTSWTLAGGTTDKDHVVVTATFSDGSQQVILDTYV
ncbi:type IV pilin [Methanoculleus sp. FWC-SCC1]|uniref:Type IV pilin n=1 Tax=Methanoculleus frigidifontis TaxID=2584085 RepID=A0ABT8M6K0_9EURY|nr:type IV pilin N-terminal domain-containing protein [Methanoculleus sp. FWC-SCC1]MDN7023558.1 type IV pilin [Methanoculleus sp. FWC-SCC1]